MQSIVIPCGVAALICVFEVIMNSSSSEISGIPHGGRRNSKYEFKAISGFMNIVQDSIDPPHNIQSLHSV